MVDSKTRRWTVAICGGGSSAHILIAMAGRLVTSASARGDYRSAKGGAITMDLDRIASELLGASLPSVALLLLLSALSVPVLTWLWIRKEEAVFGFLGRLFDRTG